MLFNVLSDCVDVCYFASTGFGNGNVTCDFDFDCGYVDESNGEDRWIPYTEHVGATNSKNISIQHSNNLRNTSPQSLIVFIFQL